MPNNISARPNIPNTKTKTSYKPNHPPRRFGDRSWHPWRSKKAVRGLSPIPTPFVFPHTSFLSVIVFRDVVVKLGAGVGVGVRVRIRVFIMFVLNGDLKHTPPTVDVDGVTVKQNPTPSSTHSGGGGGGGRGGGQGGADGPAVVARVSASAMTTIPATIGDARAVRELLNALHGLSPSPAACPRQILYGALLNLRVPPLPPVSSTVVAASAGGRGGRERAAAATAVVPVITVIGNGTVIPTIMHLTALTTSIITSITMGVIQDGDVAMYGLTVGVVRKSAPPFALLLLPRTRAALQGVLGGIFSPALLSGVAVTVLRNFLQGNAAAARRAGAGRGLGINGVAQAASRPSTPPIPIMAPITDAVVDVAVLIVVVVITVDFTAVGLAIAR